jgi:hypothetical protein
MIDQWSLAVVAGQLGLIAVMAPDHRSHAETIETLLVWLLYAVLAPVVGGLAAMFAGAMLLMMALFFCSLFFCSLWLLVSLFYFIVFV